jgi:hypothetical protein
MKIIHMPRPNEQRKVEALLVKLAKMKAIHSKAVPTPSALRTA